MRRKYMGSGDIYGIKHKSRDFAPWSDMLQYRDLYLCGRKMQIGNGKRTDFWGDSWCGFTPLKEKIS
jgi:hypothetical protein